MNKIESLTPEQESIIPLVRQEWLDKIFNCDKKIDRGLATNQIKWLYKFCNLEEPVVIFLSSPYAAQIGANYLKLMVGAQVRDQGGAQVVAQVRDQVWAQVGAQVRDQVGDQVWAQVRDQV